MHLFPVCFIDRGKARSRLRIQSWIRDRVNATIQDLEQEADRLADRLEEHMTDKRKRDFQIRLLKDELEKRKTYPRGVPPGPSREELQEQREREAEKKRKDAEFQLKVQRKFERQPFQLFLKDQKANLAKDPDFYRRDPPPAYMRREFLTTPEKKALDAARAVWPKRFGGQLPEVMTASECRKAVTIGLSILAR